MRASRLVTLLLLLQTRGRMTAAELARELEVSERTVHRDVEALSEAGVPVYAERGPHGGVQLVEGYRTRLTGMTADEAEALFLSGLPGPAAELGLGTVMTAAQLKVMAALPGELRARASRLVERFYLDAAGWFHGREPVPHLSTLAEAVWESRRVTITYQRGDSRVERALEPLGLVLKAGTWYVVAANEDQLRTYRVSGSSTRSRLRSASPALTTSIWVPTGPSRAPPTNRRSRGSPCGFGWPPIGSAAWVTSWVAGRRPRPRSWTSRIRRAGPSGAEHGLAGGGAWSAAGAGGDVEILDPPDARETLITLASGALARNAPLA